MSQPKFSLPSYPWVIVLIAAAAMVATLPGRTHGLGMITERLLDDPQLQLSRISYSQINLIATLLGGLFCLPCGWLIDRIGLRVTLTGTLVALGTVVILMTRLTDLTSFSIAILLTRGFGQSALSVISITMVGKWFRGSLTMPMAIYSLVLSLGFAFAAQLAKPYADTDWRVLWGGIGWIVLGFVPLALLFAREPRPINIGGSRQPDLQACCASNSNASPLPIQPDATLTQAVQTSAFWVFGISISLVALVGSGISLFNESVLVAQGFPKELFYDLLTWTGIIGLAAKLPIGWIGQKVAPQKMLAFGLVLLCICLACLPLIHTYAAIYLYAAGMGISGAITTVLFFSFWGQAYGQTHLGSIQAVAQGLTVVASSIGPILFANVYDKFGQYTVAFYALAACAGLLALAAWFVSMPRFCLTTTEPLLAKSPA